MAKIDAFLKSIEMPCDDYSAVDDFHESTKLSPMRDMKVGLSISNYLFSPKAVKETAANYKTFEGAPYIQLKADSGKSQTSFKSVSVERVSTHAFAPQQTSIEEISDLMSVTRVARRAQTMVKGLEFGLRQYPSAGALYPIEIYLAVLAKADLPKGIYHYSPITHRLVKVNDIQDSDAVLEKSLGDFDCHRKSASLFVFLTMFSRRALVKYNARGYRFCLLEAGVLAHHISLSAGSIGLGSLHWGGYSDDLCDKLVNATPGAETMVHGLWIGKPAELAN